MSRTEASIKLIIRHLVGVNFTVVAKPSSHHCDFDVYEIASREPTITWSLPDKCSPEFTEDLSKAEKFLHGFIKWDGCSNWHFDIQDGCMIHFCSADESQAIGNLFRELYLIADELIPNWNN